jgi:hypothetical protein
LNKNKGGGGISASTNFIIKQRRTNIMTKKIFSRKLAIYLREHGCKIISIEVNKHKPNLDVYIFEDGDKLQAALTEYMANK